MTAFALVVLVEEARQPDPSARRASSPFVSPVVIQYDPAFPLRSWCVGAVLASVCTFKQTRVGMIDDLVGRLPVVQGIRARIEEVSARQVFPQPASRSQKIAHLDLCSGFPGSHMHTPLIFLSFLKAQIPTQPSGVDVRVVIISQEF